MAHQYVVEDPELRDITFHELVNLLRTNNKVKVFERTLSGELIAVNVKFVDDLTINGQIANSATVIPDGMMYVLKDGRVVKNYDHHRIGRVVMAKIISYLPGFLPVTVEKTSFTYPVGSQSFSGNPRKYVYQLFKAVYQLHRRGLCHLRLSRDSISLVNDELMISDYEEAKACYSTANAPMIDIQACAKLICFMTTGTMTETTPEFENLVRDCLNGSIPRVTRALQDKLFKEILDIELVSVRPPHVYCLVSLIQPNRESSVKLTNLLTSKLEPSVSQSLAIEILLLTGIYSLELARELVGVPGSEAQDIDPDVVVSAFVDADGEVGVVGSTGHLIESYGSGPDAYRAMLSLYALPDLNQCYFAGLANIFDARLRKADPSPDVEDIAPGDDAVYARHLKIAQPVPSGLTKQELESLS